MDKQKILIELQKIPGVGKTIAKDLWDLGIRSIPELKGKDPEQLYQALCLHQNCHVDRCMLYVFRCAVYYASEKNPKPELLKWWKWKDTGQS